jgi:hypothetical protein
VSHNGKLIGSAETDNYSDIGTWHSYAFYASEDAEEIKAAIQTARDEALTEARNWIKTEVEAIQSGKREAELFAAITALNTQPDPNADLKALGYRVEHTGFLSEGLYFVAYTPNKNLISHSRGKFEYRTEADAWQACRKYAEKQASQ